MLQIKIKEGGLHLTLKVKSGPFVESTSCAKCGIMREGKHLASMGVYYRYGKSDHQFKYYAIGTPKGKQGYQSASNAPIKNRFYSL